MRTFARGLALSAVLLLLTGCGGMAGQWAMHSITPESAKAEFALSGLCLNKDGTFVACMDCGTKINGTWDYNADDKLLTFKDDKGKARSYEACLCGTSGNLLVSSAEEGKDWKAAMERGKCCTACGCGSKCCGGKTCAGKTCDVKTCDPKKCPGNK
ncbi:MAG: hypothetical protein ABIG44_11870 [Planctomycetota bacterium]